MEEDNPIICVHTRGNNPIIYIVSFIYQVTYWIFSSFLFFLFIFYLLDSSCKKCVVVYMSIEWNVYCLDEY